MTTNAAKSSKGREISRRDFVQRSLAGAGAAGIVGAMSAKAQGRGCERDAPCYGSDELWLVNRITMGYSRQEGERAKHLGYDGYLEYQLDHLNIDDSEVQEWLDDLDTLPLSNNELWSYRNNPEAPRFQLKRARVWRSSLSQRQLFERMVDFWTDHFNIYHDKEHTQIFKTADDRDVIRQHALGFFPDMLRASARSSAMLWYLDNHLNTRLAPNENYAREVMELHTLGVDGPYSELDVIDVARCFTGWSIQLSADPTPGEYIFRANDHDIGPKLVLGVPIPPGGAESDADTVLDILAHHPKTADFVSRKMCRWLLGYEPSESVVQATVSAYLRTGGSIKDMIRVILNRQTLQWRDSQVSDPWHEYKFKRPYHAVISLIRAVQPHIRSWGPRYIIRHLDEMVMVPFGKESPDGYPDTADAWNTALLPRWTFISDLLEDQILGVSMVPEVVMKLMGLDPQLSRSGSMRNAQTLADGINLMLMGGAMPQEKVDLIHRYLIDYGTDWTVIREAIALAASSPSYSYY